MRTELTTEADRSVTVTPHPGGQLSALILGFFAAAWFGWAHGGTPNSWAVSLDVASLVCVLVAVFAAVRVWRGRRHGGARPDPGLNRRYGIVVGISYAVLGIGAAVLGVTGHPEFIASWVALVIGVHFWALVSVLSDRSLIPLGIVVVTVAVCAVVLDLTTSASAVGITGVGTGAALLIAALYGLQRTTRQGHSS